MPLMKCESNGESGWKFGDSGKCYCGPNGKRMAIRQLLAEHDGKFVNASLLEEILDDPSFTDEQIATAIELSDVAPPLRATAYITADKRKSLPAEDFAGPHRSFPIFDTNSLNSAIHLVGHADDPEAVKRRIIEIAKRKGLESALPESWKS